MCARFRDVVLVSEMLCTFPSSCARFTELLHVSQKLCTFHKLPNNFRVQHTERILIRKSIGATKHVLPIYIYIYVYIYTYIYVYIYVYIYIYMYMYRYIHTSIDTHTNLCIYICMYVYELYVIQYKHLTSDGEPLVLDAWWSKRSPQWFSRFARPFSCRWVPRSSWPGSTWSRFLRCQNRRLRGGGGWGLVPEKARKKAA